MGLIYGLFLYKKPGKEILDWKFILRLILSSLIVLGIIKIFIEAAFLNILYDKAYFAVISARIVTQAIMLPIQVITIFFLEKMLRPFANKYLYEEDTDVNEKQKDTEKNGELYLISFLLPIVGIILGCIYIGKNKERMGKSLILFSIAMSIIETVGCWLIILNIN